MGYHVVNRLTGRLIVHQNSPIESCDYDSSEWLINPELPPGVSPDHYKVVGDSVLEIDSGEKAVVDLGEARSAKHAEIGSWYDSQLATGYDTGNGYFLAALFIDQTRFTQDAVLQRQLLDAETASGDDFIGFLDAAGLPHVATIDNYLSILASYGSWCRAKLIQQATLRGQLAMAATIEEIQAIDPNAS